MDHENGTRGEMLELLSDIVQSSGVTGDLEQDLLNFLSELEELFPND
ncbi:hypothetical protein LNN31_00525 [Acetobacterium wieringae]|uniref:Uncharacterized protein n=1 Tax=Acetobacterium wieringae TaxID=52694 RepID=A0ABY6HEL9_9FIRM|nr:hypothetical protein [Acetobacterium wieringae]UYO62967.1 hypothetical protein LNN31_00525 [Acetobacterium wieringae]VUZ26889.1 Uncharacterised protein [Acetobacterium wieringae]